MQVDRVNNGIETTADQHHENSELMKVVTVALYSQVYSQILERYPRPAEEKTQSDDHRCLQNVGLHLRHVLFRSTK